MNFQVHHVLQSIYESNAHPDDENWKDPRGHSGASLSENTEISPELMDLAQAGPFVGFDDPKP